MYVQLTPHAALSPYIESYWRLDTEASGPPFREAIWVDGQADLLFNFGAPYLRSADGVDRRVTAAHLDAHRIAPITIAQHGAIRLIGVRFRFGGLAAFLPVPMGELSDRLIDLDALFGPAACELEYRLFDAAHDPAAQTALLDSFFLRRLSPDDRQRPIRALVERLLHDETALSVRAMSAIVGYSPRTLDRLFLHYTGFTPKQAARIARMGRVIAALSAAPDTPLIALAARHGFSDQAHMTHDARALTGLTPAQIRESLLSR